MSGFEFGVGLFPTEPLQKMIHLAQVSEEVDFSHIWVGDSHLIWREAYINMAAMMLNTSKVKLGTGVTNPLTRHPSVVASGYATLEEYGPGRMIVGIGLGDSSVETMGMKPSTLANFEKSLGQMRAILDGEEAELDVALEAGLTAPEVIFLLLEAGQKRESEGRKSDGAGNLSAARRRAPRRVKCRMSWGAGPIPKGAIATRSNPRPNRGLKFGSVPLESRLVVRG
jgi:hypothetical protein